MPWSALPSEPAVEYLDIEDLIALAARLQGGPPALRDAGLLGSAAARAQATDYPDIWSKAGALLQSIVKNQGLVDGNKSLGWLATAVFLSLNGQSVTNASNDAVYDLVVAVGAKYLTVEQIAGALRALAASG
jgi:death-on-curing protein